MIYRQTANPNATNSELDAKVIVKHSPKSDYEKFQEWLNDCPVEIVNYLVVHELCHLIHFNHSKSYWHEVEKNLPKYKEYRKWLKLNGHKLTI